MDKILFWLLTCMLCVSTLFLMTTVYRVIKLGHQRLTQSSYAHLNELFLFIPPGRLLLASMISGSLLGYGVYQQTGYVWLSACCLVSAAVIPQLTLQYMRKKRVLKFRQQLPDSLSMMALIMRSGSNLSQALETVVNESTPPLNQELGLVLREIRLGNSPEQAFYGLENRINIEPVKLMVAGILISRETGGNLSLLFLSLSSNLKKTFEIEQKIDALTAQGRMQGRIMSGLPLLLLIALQVMEPEAMIMLWTTPAGLAIAGLAGILLITGAWVIQKIVKIQV